MPRSPRTGHLRTFATLVALLPLACATAHEEPPAPPPPPVDPAAFSGPARDPAPSVDLSADLDAGSLWLDSAPPPLPAAAPDAASPPPKRKR